MTDFEPRLNAARPLMIISDQKRAVATLHDHQSGEPLETCLTPCRLNGRANLTYDLALYKKGYWPQLIPLEVNQWERKPEKISLGFNLNRMMKDRQACFAVNKRGFTKDGDAVPCARMPPSMPHKARRSGHCMVEFDIRSNGIPVNVNASQCSDEVFKEASEFAIQWWVYKPKIDRGIAVDRIGVQSKMKFNLTDKDGNIIPEG